ncbi:hypothetical protein AYJ54_11800 [Bradyrhizobium centrolobii]|uniref:Uncharacterized protein n=1 Tax=Bradyrhizobium centrolobii TaxID=1505087 RepID=A0A176YQH1_9BRAD|nr:hypothetical protein AYJ54_11800 [Bradyrhizobium centrolobii]
MVDSDRHSRVPDALQRVYADAGRALLWWSFLAQRDPMAISNDRFRAGWSALVSVLGAPRMTAIAAALGVEVGA